MTRWDEVPCRISGNISREDNYEFHKDLAEYNPQRIKSVDSLLKEVLLRGNDDIDTRDAIEEYDEASCVVDVDFMNVEGIKGVEEIGDRKQEFLDAVVKVVNDMRSYWPLSVRQIHYNLLKALPLEWQTRFEDIMQRCLRGEAVRNIEFVIPDKCGEMIPVLATVSLLTDESGEPLGIAQIVKNITELKRTAQELQRSNRELEHFAAVVAHDLQQSLSTMKGYYELLERHHHNEFSEQAQGFVNSIGDGIKQAQTFVGDLLSYSCLDRQAKPVALVNCSDAVNRALTNLRSSIDESTAEITCRDLPIILCDGSQLVQLFENLIGNAVKYHGNQSPQVEISTERQGENWIFCVADNGIGIDSANHGFVFDMCARLHPKDKYPGTGIGLAICRKIVERHGGRIWVESQPGCGSRFFFSLPVPENGNQ